MFIMHSYHSYLVSYLVLPCKILKKDKKPDLKIRKVRIIKRFSNK